jgi:hypothetical protein
MSQRTDTTAASAGQGEREENRWIKSGSRIDLEGMTIEPIRQLAGALAARGWTQANPTDAPLTSDIGKDMTYPDSKGPRSA